MKRLLYIFFILCFVLTGCSDNKTDDTLTKYIEQTTGKFFEKHAKIKNTDDSQYLVTLNITDDIESYPSGLEYYFMAYYYAEIYYDLNEEYGDFSIEFKIQNNDQTKLDVIMTTEDADSELLSEESAPTKDAFADVILKNHDSLVKEIEE